MKVTNLPFIIVLTPEERRARKAKRREEQRHVNISRAAKMHASRLTSPLVLQIPNTALPKINVGCSGWFYWHWRGSFYPDSLPTKEWFAYYSQHFSTVELNAPFYSWPTVSTVKGWVKQSPARAFIYTVKVCEIITHVKRFVGTKTLVKDFGFIGDLLKERTGCFLFQLPPSYFYTARRLNVVLEQLEPQRRNVIEFRHRTWWNEKVYTAFRKKGVIFCSCSAPRLPDKLVKTADEVYIRFHGLKKWYSHDYAPDELAVWASRIKQSKCKRVWAYFNHDRDCHALRNAKELSRQLRVE